MIYLKSESEIDKMRESALIVSRTLAEVGKHIKPGVQSGKVDRIAEDSNAKEKYRTALIAYAAASKQVYAPLTFTVTDADNHATS